MERIQWVFNTERTMVPRKIRIKLEREKYLTNRKGFARSGLGGVFMGALSLDAIGAVYSAAPSKFSVEVVSKPPLGPKSGVGALCPILKILNVFTLSLLQLRCRLATTLRLDFEPD
jgi:hypothetical protein